MGVEENKEVWFFQAQDLLQQAYNVDSGLPSQMTQDAILANASQLGPLPIHRAYYDGGLSSIPEIEQLLKAKPDGALASLLLFVRDRRDANGDYDIETLNKIYGLS